MRLLIATMIAGALLLSCAWAAEPADTSSAPTLTGVEIFPLGELTLGMKGTARTVIRGTKVETFDVEVLEVIPDGGFDGGPMILARFTGPVVDFSDGIAGGYSGSPVYIGGKLVGAVSMAMPNTDTHIGGITPIGQMLKSLPDGEELDFSSNTVLPATEKNGTPVDEDGKLISYTNDYELARQLNDEARRAGSDHLVAVPAKTPIYFAGISPGVFAQYSDQLSGLLGSQLQLMDVPMGRARDYGLLLSENGDVPGLLLHETSKEPPLKPGDACVVTFVEGDVELYGVGTVTYSDPEGRFLLFGHMMMGEGDSHFPVGLAYITWTHGSIVRAFKQGVRLNTLGTVTKDHAAGCGGSFEIEPEMIPVRFKLNDADTGASATKRFKVVRHKDFTPMLISLAISQAAAEMLDREPGGTMKFSYHIEGVGLKDHMRRTNYYYDERYVLSNAAYELMPIADLLANNVYREVKIDKIEILAEVTRNRRNASIDEADFILDDEQEVEEPPTGDEGESEEEPDLRTIDETLEMIEAEQAVAPAEGQAWQAPRLRNLRGRRAVRLQEPAPGPEQAGEEELYPPGMIGPEFPEDIPTFAPGDTVAVKVRLQPYRTDPIWRRFEIQIPEDFPSGGSSLYIHGGGDLMSWDELGGKGRSLFGFGPLIDLRDRELDTIIDQIVEAPLNNELLLTLTRPYDYSEELNGNGGSGDDDEEVEDHVDEKYQMEWVIYNSFMLPLNIQGDEPNGPPNGPPTDNGDYDDESEDENNAAADEYETDLPF